MRFKQGSVLLVSSLLIAACGGGGGSSSSSSDAGSFTLGLTDGPVENASEVVITFTAVELHGAESKVIELDPPMSLNLLNYQGESRALLLDDEALTAGSYQWIRLAVDESASYIEINGQQHLLDIPSNAQTGLQLNRGFTIGQGNTSDFTIDFDLRKSIHQQGVGDYKLRPTLRLVDNLEVSTINGVVTESLITDVACNNGNNNDEGNAVYLFEGSDSTLQDIQGNGTDPITSATVSYNDETQSYEFQIGYVTEGEYTIAFTCDALLDIADEDNSVDVAFSAGVNVSVTADENSSVVIPGNI